MRVTGWLGPELGAEKFWMVWRVNIESYKPEVLFQSGNQKMLVSTSRICNEIFSGYRSIVNYTSFYLYSVSIYKTVEFLVHDVLQLTTDARKSPISDQSSQGT